MAEICIVELQGVNQRNQPCHTPPVVNGQDRGWILFLQISIISSTQEGISSPRTGV